MIVITLLLNIVEQLIIFIFEMANLNRKQAGSNWENANNSKNVSPKKLNNTQSQTLQNKGNKNQMKFIAMDCEMVGIGSNGEKDMLARVSIVNQKGDILMDKFVKPLEEVTDYRTKVSGIRPKNIENAENFYKIQNEVVNLLQNKILVGHSINKDLAVLYIKHPHKYIRDTAKYRPLAKLVSNGSTPSLKKLSKAILGIDIQSGEHNSVEDARATMNIYNRFSAEWEKYIKKRIDRNHHQYQSFKRTSR